MTSGRVSGLSNTTLYFVTALFSVRAVGRQYWNGMRKENAIDVMVFAVDWKNPSCVVTTRTLLLRGASNDRLLAKQMSYWIPKQFFDIKTAFEILRHKARLAHGFRKINRTGEERDHITLLSTSIYQQIRESYVFTALLKHMTAQRERRPKLKWPLRMRMRTHSKRCSWVRVGLKSLPSTLLAAGIFRGAVLIDRLRFLGTAFVSASWCTRTRRAWRRII